MAPPAIPSQPVHGNLTAGAGVPPYQPPVSPRFNSNYGHALGFPVNPQGSFGGGYTRTPTGPVKRYTNWKACYSCSFDVADGLTSMLHPPHLWKASHQINFKHQIAQQLIDLGHPCSTKNRHKMQFPPPL